MDVLNDRLINMMKSSNPDITDEKLEEIKRSLHLLDLLYIEQNIKKKTNKVIKLKREIRKLEKEIESLIKLRE